MTRFDPGRPTDGEHTPYYGHYIDLVPSGAIIALLEKQIGDSLALLAALTQEQEAWRPAPGEWNTTEIVGHLADTERVLAYRALRIARADQTPMEGVEDFGPYVPAAGFAPRPLAAVAEEFVAVRAATVALFAGLDQAAWTRCGTADGNTFSPRALAYIIAGHESHHLADIRRYRDASSQARKRKPQPTA